MARTISHFLNNIVLRLDRIPNEALKTYRPLITPWLTDIARAYFVIGFYLRLKKAMTMVILYKKGKTDYLFLGNYRFITLKNTLSKILKRVIIKYIENTAKEYALLL